MTLKRALNFRPPFSGQTLFNIAALALFAGVVCFAQVDPVNAALTKVENQALTWSNILCVLGMLILGGKYIFDSRHGHGDSMGTVIGATILIGARAAASFYFGAQ